MSTKKKSRKRTGSFKRGNPRELKDALSAAGVQAPNLLSLYLEEMDAFYSTASVLVADLEDRLDYALMLRSVVSELALAGRQKLAPVVTEHFQVCQRLTKQLKVLSNKGMESHKKRSRVLGGANYRTVRSISLSETGEEETLDGLSDSLAHLLDPNL